VVAWLHHARTRPGSKYVHMIASIVL
jgi:hypothetical protein